ncbi:unnamed protein product [Lampetra planeri]
MRGSDGSPNWNVISVRVGDEKHAECIKAHAEEQDTEEQQRSTHRQGHVARMSCKDPQVREESTERVALTANQAVSSLRSRPRRVFFFNSFSTGPVLSVVVVAPCSGGAGSSVFGAILSSGPFWAATTLADTVARGIPAEGLPACTRGEAALDAKGGVAGLAASLSSRSCYRRSVTASVSWSTRSAKGLLARGRGPSEVSLLAPCHLLMVWGAVPTSSADWAVSGSRPSGVL